MTPYPTGGRTGRVLVTIDCIMKDIRSLDPMRQADVIEGLGGGPTPFHKIPEGEMRAAYDTLDASADLTEPALTYLRRVRYYRKLDFCLFGSACGVFAGVWAYLYFYPPGGPHFLCGSAFSIGPCLSRCHLHPLAFGNPAASLTPRPVVGAVVDAGLCA